MLKYALMAVTLSVTLVSTAYAQDAATGVSCDGAGFDYVMLQMDKKMTEASDADKAAAKVEVDAAMRDHDSKLLDTCAVHLGNAVRILKVDLASMPKG